ncbi:MAG: hypothetical protein MUP21_14335 [Dehalococcoidia bacterium]|nr:hypothetical protein [Dehalococcoidia bacterium]
MSESREEGVIHKERTLIDAWPTAMPMIAMKQVLGGPGQFGFLFKDERDAIYLHPTFTMGEVSDYMFHKSEGGVVDILMTPKKGFVYPPKEEFTRTHKFLNTTDMLINGWFSD